jgi:hypothetical protein
MHGLQVQATIKVSIAILIIRALERLQKSHFAKQIHDLKSSPGRSWTAAAQIKWLNQRPMIATPQSRQFFRFNRR